MLACRVSQDIRMYASSLCPAPLQKPQAGFLESIDALLSTQFVVVCEQRMIDFRNVNRVEACPEACRGKPF